MIDFHFFLALHSIDIIFEQLSDNRVRKEESKSALGRPVTL